MSNERIPVREAAKEWLKDPAFRAEYEALEPEFALASALIEARSRAGMTQAQVAKAMGTTQAVIAHLEGRARQTLDPDAGALRQGHRHPPPYPLRARAYAGVIRHLAPGTPEDLGPDG